MAAGRTGILVRKIDSIDTLINLLFVCRCKISTNEMLMLTFAYVQREWLWQRKRVSTPTQFSYGKKREEKKILKLVRPSFFNKKTKRKN